MNLEYFQKELKQFNFLYKELDDMYHAAALESGLSDTAFCIFYTLVYHGGGCLQKEIANWYSQSPQTINSAVKKLEKQGLLRLEAGKGRERRLHLTETGKQLAREKIIPVLQKESLVFEKMPPGELRELLRLTEKLVALYRQQFQGNGEQKERKGERKER